MIFLPISQHYVFTEESGKACHLKINISRKYILLLFVSKKSKIVNVMHTNKSSISISACLTKCKNACLTEVEEIHSAKMF